MGLGGGQPLLDDGKHPIKCIWFDLTTFTNFMLALIVLSSITKKREIVTNMAPFMPFRVILDRMTTQSMGLMLLSSEYF